MLGFRKKEQAAAVSVQTRPEESFRLGRAAPPGPGERALRGEGPVPGPAGEGAHH